MRKDESVGGVGYIHEYAVHYPDVIRLPSVPEIAHHGRSHACADPCYHKPARQTNVQQREAIR